MNRHLLSRSPHIRAVLGTCNNYRNFNTLINSGSQRKAFYGVGLPRMPSLVKAQVLTFIIANATYALFVLVGH